MVATALVYARIEAPEVKPHPFGLFSVAPPATPSGTDWQVGVSWESWACMTPNVTRSSCIDGLADAPPKEMDVCPNTQDVKPFTVYMGVKLTGQSQDVARTQAGAILEDAEEYAVEQGLWQTLAADVTESAALSPLGALAAVEDALADGYMGLGTIHMSRGMATRLGTVLVRNGDHIETTVGTPVAVGAGYESTAIYGTGGVLIARGPVDTIEAFAPSVNDLLVIAERTYVVNYDCFATGSLVSPAT
jgi:hypothetical protein